MGSKSFEEGKEIVEVELVYKNDTMNGKCFIVRHPNGRPNQVIFLPKSIVERDGHIFKMPKWLAVEKGIDNLIKE